MLKKTILSVLESNIDKKIISSINIIIVDNDIDKTAQEVVKNFNLIDLNRIAINYYNNPSKGLSNVRNELFNKALEHKADYIVGIDDDEYMSADCLNQLLNCVNQNGGDIALGPVMPVFENKVSPYISYWFKHNSIPDQQSVNFFESNNFIISTRFLLKYKLKFDIRFNSTGGEDHYFGITALKKKAKIYWAANATAYENIPFKRASLKWLVMRRYRGAITFIYVLKLEKQQFKIIKKLLVSVFYFLIGIIGLLALISSFKWRYWGILKIAESLGGFSGLINIQYHEYQK